MIGIDTTITVVSMNGDKVRPRIDGPRNRSVHRQRRFRGWSVLYTTSDPGHPYVQCCLKELRIRFRGIRADATFDATEQTLEVIPPKGVEIGESDRVGCAMERLLEAIHDQMQRELAG